MADVLVSVGLLIGGEKFVCCLFWMTAVRLVFGTPPLSDTSVLEQLLCFVDGLLILFKLLSRLLCELVVVVCFYQPPAAGITERPHLNVSVTLYLSFPCQPLCPICGCCGEVHC